MKRRAAVALLVAAVGCGKAPGPPTIPYDTLAEYQLFVGPLAEHNPADGVIPYDVNSTLFADGAGKLRFIVVPKGQKIHFDPTARWGFPDGAMVVKTFYYDLDAKRPAAGRRLLETRLLINQGGSWATHTYVWNDAQTGATRYAAGQAIRVDRLDENGAMVSVDYQVPSSSQCKNCHGQDKILTPLGPRTRQLNRTHDYGAGPENQIAHLAMLGLLDADPGPPAMLDALAAPNGTAPTEARARAYLDANCAHCHNESGFASSTNLRLNSESTVAIDLGVCRHPVAAGMGSGGLIYDVVPGKPDQSILIYRMKSNDPQFKMPQLPLTTVDAFGAQLVSQWISGLVAPPCQ